MILNEGMYRVSIICKKIRGCPRLMETLTFATEGKLYSTATHLRTFSNHIVDQKSETRFDLKRRIENQPHF